MQDLTKFRRELACVAGVKLTALDYEKGHVPESFWRPDEDTNQSLQILDHITRGQMGNVFIRRNDGPLSADWEVIISYEDLDGKATAAGLAEAICLAVIAVLDLNGEE